MGLAEEPNQRASLHARRGRGSLRVQLNHVLNQPKTVIAFERQQRFRMKLHSLDRQFAMAHCP